MKFIKSRGSQKTRFSPIFKHFDTTSKNTYFHSFSQPQKQFKSFIHSFNRKNHRKNHSFIEKIKENQIKIKKKTYIQWKIKKNSKTKKNSFYKKPTASNGWILQKIIHSTEIHRKPQNSHTFTHKYTQLDTNTYIFTHIYTHIHTIGHIYTHIHTNRHIYTHPQIHTPPFCTPRITHLNKQLIRDAELYLNLGRANTYILTQPHKYTQIHTEYTQIHTNRHRIPHKTTQYDTN